MDKYDRIEVLEIVRDSLHDVWAYIELQPEVLNALENAMDKLQNKMEEIKEE